jgi:hypothetical protein
MTLCEALNWCRANRATVTFGSDHTTVQVGPPHDHHKKTGTALEETVEMFSSPWTTGGSVGSMGTKEDS